MNSAESSILMNNQLTPTLEVILPGIRQPGKITFVNKGILLTLVSPKCENSPTLSTFSVIFHNWKTQGITQHNAYILILLHWKSRN